MKEKCIICGKEAVICEEEVSEWVLYCQQIMRGNMEVHYCDKCKQKGERFRALKDYYLDWDYK